MQLAVEEELHLPLHATTSQHGKMASRFKGVYTFERGQRRFLARLNKDGKSTNLGCFHTEEEAALVLARARRGAS